MLSTTCAARKKGLGTVSDSPGRAERVPEPRESSKQGLESHAERVTKSSSEELQKQGNDLACVLEPQRSFDSL